MPLSAFLFKKFSVAQDGAAHPVGTDAVLLGAWADVRNVNRFLDIGTGTGVLALMIAQRRNCTGDFSRRETMDLTIQTSLSGVSNLDTNWLGIGVEIHPLSAALARGNFAASPWASKLKLWEGSIQKFSGIADTNDLSQPFDLIVSNPPFFSETTISSDKARSLGRHTATLTQGDLLETVSQLLTPHGKFCVILPELEGRRLCELAVPIGLYWTKVLEVRSRPAKPVERLLLQFEKSPYGFEKQEICVYAEKNGPAFASAGKVEYSNEFQEMTRDFYLTQ